ncbi:dihydrofolate reductase family protein [Nocardioides sp. KIGAM211]|uniref:Dihydrofolate reductase family protein n=1 Tax=Nocardioides luti TaxID=2761101 RepID=A0A7X0VBU6_9ACTN|nr:dihydrofolate reductase family protein [Nocardioides luti]MBB6628317.1 dihydrofolate reductase family protein [Nocardioides luti]
MGLLHYSALMSLDGYVVDADGRFDWAAPDEEVHAFVNEMTRPIGTYLYGRRMYDVMTFWETAETDDEPPVFGEWAAMWRAADKVVFSSTLGPEDLRSARTRLEPRCTADALRRLKDETPGALSIGGATVAAEAFAAGLVDDVQLFLAPVVVGGGTRGMPDGVRLDLELVDERRFAGGFVTVRYAVGGGGAGL